jgi:hypothetical protein
MLQRAYSLGYFFEAFFQLLLYLISPRKNSATEDAAAIWARNMFFDDCFKRLAAENSSNRPLVCFGR